MVIYLGFAVRERLRHDKCGVRAVADGVGRMVKTISTIPRVPENTKGGGVMGDDLNVVESGANVRAEV